MLSIKINEYVNPQRSPEGGSAEKKSKREKVSQHTESELKAEALKSAIWCFRTVTYHHMFYSSLDSWCSSTSD